MTAHAKFEPATEIQPGLRVDRLLMLADHLERPEVAEHFNMRYWVKRWCLNPGNWISDLGNLYDCGTTACIAGHTAWLFGSRDAIDPIPHVARQILGLTLNQAGELFTPMDTYHRFIEYTNLQAAATVRHLALTGVVDWNR